MGPVTQLPMHSTFYTMFNRSRIGKFHIMVCGTTPCQLNGSKGIYHAISDLLGIGFGDTTEVRFTCVLARGEAYPGVCGL